MKKIIRFLSDLSGATKEIRKETNKSIKKTHGIAWRRDN